MSENKYFKCVHCLQFFEAVKKRTYCTRKCRDAAYYLRRKDRENQLA